MLLLADENVPGVVVAALRGAGIDVAWIREVAPGSADDAVLKRARDGGRLVLTFDKDFGELIYARGLNGSRGVILVRVTGLLPDALAALMVQAVGSRGDWEGRFSVIEDGRVRMRPLPAVVGA